jgi:hypothetical protein
VRSTGRSPTAWQTGEIERLALALNRYVCYFSIAYAMVILGLRADLMPRFATHDLNGRQAATLQLSFADYSTLGLLVDIA